MPSPGEQALQLVRRTIGKAIDDGQYQLPAPDEGTNRTWHAPKRSLIDRSPPQSDKTQGPNVHRTEATHAHSPIEPRDDITASRMHLSSYRKHRSQTVPDTLQTGAAPRNHVQPKGSSSTLDGRFETHHLPPSPTQRDPSRELGVYITTSPSMSRSYSEPNASAMPIELPMVPAVHRSVNPSNSPVLCIAQAVYASVHQLQGHVNFCSSLTHTMSPGPSSFERTARDAELYLNELGWLLQNEPGSSGELRTACETVIKAYQAICSDMLEYTDIIVDNADAHMMSELLNTLYSSILSMRTHLAGLATVRDNAGQGFSPTVPTRSSSRGFQEVQRLVSPPYSPVITESMGEHRSRTTTPTPMDYSTAPDGFSDNTRELSGVLLIALRRSCIVALKVLPHFHEWFRQTCGELDNRTALSQGTATWQAALTSCAKVISQAETIHSRLLAAELHSPVVIELYAFVSDLVEAWTDFIQVIRSSPNIINLSAVSRTELNHIQKTLKEATGLVVALRATAESSALPLAPSSSHASPPLTPRQASRSLAIRNGFPF